MKKVLTNIQQNVLDYIIEFQSKKGYPPTLAEISYHFKWGRSGSRGHVKALEKKGYVQRTSPHRGIEVL